MRIDHIPELCMLEFKNWQEFLLAEFKRLQDTHNVTLCFQTEPDLIEKIHGVVNKQMGLIIAQCVQGKLLCDGSDYYAHQLSNMEIQLMDNQENIVHTDIIVWSKLTTPSEDFVHSDHSHYKISIWIAPSLFASHGFM